MNFRKLILAFFPSLALFMGILIKMNDSWWFLLLFIFIFTIPAVLGAIYIGHNFFIRSINSLRDIDAVSGSESDIVLTFDDGIHPEWTPKVLDILKAHHVNAMFFVIGKNIKGNEDILKRLVEEGHTLGNHSFTHDRWFDLKSTRKMLSDLKQMNETAQQVLTNKWVPVYFRPPYGVTNPNLAKAIRQSGMISVGWNVRSMDTIAKSKEQLLEKLRKMTRPGAIVLLHDRCPVTVDTLTDYIVYCKQQGFTFTTLK
jgi:hypothetical protein